MKVYVVTDSEGGWDCVRGVYSTLKQAVEEFDGKFDEKLKYTYQYDLTPYMIHEKEFYTPKEDKTNPYHIDYKRQTKIDFKTDENRT